MSPARRVDINTIEGVLDRLKVIRKKPQDHLDEIRDIWTMWKDRLDDVTPTERRQFRLYIAKIKDKLTDEQNRKAFGVRGAVVKKIEIRESVIEEGHAVGAEVPVQLEREMFFAKRRGAGGGITGEPKIGIELYSRLVRVAGGEEQARNIQEGLARAGAAQAMGMDATEQGREVAARLEALGKERMAQALGLAGGKKGQQQAREILRLLREGDILAALNQAPQSAFSQQMITDINKATEEVYFNMQIFTVVIGTEKEMWKKGRWTVSLDGLLQPSVFKQFKPRIVQGEDGRYTVKFEEKEGGKKELGLSAEAGAKVVRELRKYHNIGMRIVIERPSEKLAKINDVGNLIGKAEIFYEDKRGNPVRLGTLPLYYAVRTGVSTIGEVNVEANGALGIGAIKGKPVMLAVNLDWYAAQSKKRQQYPLTIRIGPQAEVVRSGWGGRGQLGLYLLAGFPGTSVKGELKGPARRGKMIGGGAEVRMLGEFSRKSFGFDIAAEQQEVTALGRKKGKWRPTGMVYFKLEW